MKMKTLRNNQMMLHLKKLKKNKKKEKNYK